MVKGYSVTFYDCELITVETRTFSPMNSSTIAPGSLRPSDAMKSSAPVVCDIYPFKRQFTLADGDEPRRSASPPRARLPSLCRSALVSLAHAVLSGEAGPAAGVTWARHGASAEPRCSAITESVDGSTEAAKRSRISPASQVPLPGPETAVLGR